MRNKVYDIVQKEQPIGRSELIKRANYGKRGGEAVINVITALGLLKCINKKYHLTEQSETYLTHSSVFSWKPIANYFTEKIDYSLKALEDENYVNEKITADWSQGSAASHEKAAQFTEYMQSLNAQKANSLAQNIDLRKKFSVNSILDVAGGSGCFT